jgi:hypothetical protein
MRVKRRCNSSRQKFDQERSWEDFKYKDLIIYFLPMYNVKGKVIPVTIWATGTISESLKTLTQQHTRKARN